VGKHLQLRPASRARLLMRFAPHVSVRVATETVGGRKNRADVRFDDRLHRGWHLGQKHDSDWPRHDSRETSMGLNVTVGNRLELPARMGAGSMMGLKISNFACPATALNVERAPD
jgi:hypothetical protein